MTRFRRGLHNPVEGFSLLCVLWALGLAALAASAATTQYSGQASFDNALYNAVTTIDFSSLGGGGSDVPMNNYPESGVTFTGAGNYLYGRNSSGGFI